MKYMGNQEQSSKVQLRLKKITCILEKVCGGSCQKIHDKKLYF
jgi:hypothetical protein